MTEKISKTFSYFGGAAIIILLIIAAPKYSYAQQDGKSKYEKIQQDKIKWNRKRLKSQRARRSRNQGGGFLNFRSFSGRRGDQPYKGNANNYSNRRRISSSSTPAVYAQPDPYAFRSRNSRKRNIYSNEGLKVSPRPPAKAWKGNIAGTPARTSPSSSKPTIYAQPNPYKYRPGRARSRNTYSNENLKSGSPPPRKARRGTIAGSPGTRNPSSSRPTIYAQPDPYKHRPGAGRERNVYSNDNLRSGSPPPSKAWKGDISGNTFRNKKQPGGKINVYPQVSPYSHRKFRSEGDRISNNQSSYGTSPRSTERPPKRGRIKTQSASGRYTVNRRANPYKLRGQHKWENTYTGGFYGRREGITPKNTQRISSHGSANPYKNRGRLGDKAYSGEISGGYKTTPRNPQRAWKGDIAGRKLRTKREPQGTANIHPSVNPYGNRLQRSEGDRISRRQDFYGATPRSTQRISQRGRVSINTASKAYLVRRKAKPYKLKDVKKWEEVYTGGFYGRREGITPRSTQRISSLASPDPYAKRGRMGDKPSPGAISGGGFRSATKKGEIAWKGDIAGRRINYSRPQDNQKVGDRFGGSPRAASISGGLHNNGGRAVNTAGGGSMTRSMQRDNKGKAILSFSPGKTAREATTSRGKQNMFDVAPGFIDGNINYQGNIKSRRPEKGGGSLSRNNWNNNGFALPNNIDERDARTVSGFSGNIRAWEPAPDGGSMSRNNWNNNGQALAKRYNDSNSKAPGSFSGSLKASRANKGGGSATRHDAWNNSESPLQKKSLTPAASKSSSFSGYRKEKKSRWSRNQKADDNALMARKPAKTYFTTGNFSGSKRQKRKVEGKTHTSTNFFTSKEKDNAVEEKKKFISFKLLWNKWFGNTTPENGDKDREPRYDKKEKGLWNE